MAHTETIVFEFGKTLQVKAEVLKARLPDELHAQDEDYPYQSIAGITQISYNTNVGNDEPEWELLEKGTDIGALFEQIKKLEGQLQSQKMQNGKLKRKLQSLGVVMEQDQEQTDA